MIEIRDAGLRAGIEQASGRSGPYEPQELSAITTLRITHGVDLSGLSHCTGLAELTMVACATRTLADAARLPRLRTLHVLACPIEDAGALAGHPTLTDLRIDFGFVEDLTPLTTIPALRHGRFLGNPITASGWAELRPRWQRSRTADTGRLRLLEFGPQEAWQYTRLTWEHGIRLCCGLLDGLRPVVVRPGIPETPGTTIDAIHGFGAAIAIAAQRGDPVELIYQRNAEWAASNGFAPPTDFASHRRLGDAQDAREWLAEAPDAEHAALQRFVAHFPDGLFYREDGVVHAAIAESAGVPVPAELAAARSVLAGILTEDDTRWRVSELPGSPRTERADDIWYLPAVGIYANEERKTLLRDQAGVFPLADWIETSRSLLAVRLTGDPAIYEFGEEDLTDTRALGRPLDESLHRVFGSYAELLAHIAAYRYPDGTEVIAQTGEA